jgi:hypothetical protein
MTCLVFDYAGQHLHFVDGADGLGSSSPPRRTRDGWRSWRNPFGKDDSGGCAKSETENTTCNQVVRQI